MILQFVSRINSELSLNNKSVVTFILVTDTFI